MGWLAVNVSPQIQPTKSVPILPGMQQGYRHFNLIQLIRDCTVRSLNYKTFRCYPPPIIQEEIQFIQKAKDIVFQELSWAAGASTYQYLLIFIKNYIQ